MAGTLTNFRHLLRIARTLTKHGLDEYLTKIHLFRSYSFIFKLIPNRWRSESDKPRGVRLREALQELGPVFIKFGQAMSTRPDLLPDDIAKELTLLQDQVPPFAGQQARDLVEAAYGESPDTVFKHFETEPMAAVSFK